MDLSYSKEEMAFREEVRDFFQTAVPKETRRKLLEGRHLSKEDMVTWQRILNKKGLAVPHWPVQWGGTGWDSVKLYIYNEEMQLAPAPQPLAFNTSMLGPVLYNVANDEQKNGEHQHSAKRPATRRLVDCAVQLKFTGHAGVLHYCGA